MQKSVGKMASIGVVSIIREALKLRYAAVSNIYDVRWWAFAVSGEHRYDMVLRAEPEYGASLAVHLFGVSSYKHTRFIDYLDKEGGREQSVDARLGQIALYLREDLTHNKYDRLTSLAVLLNRWNASAYNWTTAPASSSSSSSSSSKGLTMVLPGFNTDLASALRRRFRDIDARALVDPARQVRETYTTDDSGYAEDTVQLNSVDACRLPRDVAQRYSGLRLVADTHLYALYRNPKTGQGVVFHERSDYEPRNFVYEYPTALNIRQPRLHAVEVTVARDAEDDNERLTVCIVTIDAFAMTLKAAVSGSESRAASFIERALYAIREFGGSFTHNNLTLENVLIVDDRNDEQGVDVVIIDYSKVRKNERAAMKREFEARVLSGAPGLDVTKYNEHWDAFALFVQLFFEYPRESQLGHTVTEVFRKYVNDNGLYNVYTLDAVLNNPNDVALRFNVVEHGRRGKRITVRIDYPPLVGTPKLRVKASKDEQASQTVDYRGKKLQIQTTKLVRRGMSLGQRLGSGAFGVVFEVEGAERMVAKLTEYSKTEVQMQRAAASKGLAPTVYFKFSVKVESVDYSAATAFVTRLMIIVMERMDMRLIDVVKGPSALTALQARQVIDTTFTVVRAFGDAGFMHHDLKTDNVMVNVEEGGAAFVVKIIDFGKVWYAGDDGSINYGWFVDDEGKSEPMPLYFNSARWIGMSLTKRSNIYDTMALYMSICNNLRFRAMLDRIAKAPVDDDLWTFLTHERWRVLFTRKTRDDTEVVSAKIIDDPKVVVMTFCERLEPNVNRLWTLSSDNGELTKHVTATNMEVQMMRNILLRERTATTRVVQGAVGERRPL